MNILVTKIYSTGNDNEMILFRHFLNTRSTVYNSSIRTIRKLSKNVYCLTSVDGLSKSYYNFVHNNKSNDKNVIETIQKSYRFTNTIDNIEFTNIYDAYSRIQLIQEMFGLQDLTTVYYVYARTNTVEEQQLVSIKDYLRLLSNVKSKDFSLFYNLYLEKPSADTLLQQSITRSTELIATLEKQLAEEKQKLEKLLTTSSKI